eukprot:TRINITY_DN21642_c0_g1_i1.p1 TRINITY_DN21642_c0_g1~~TRINITY_DN21642_c0_g1_i1.p1  ORF type:complete len:253 (+),score=25.52 TRINITY_DN21642_c0_g1_i1:58-816(+)
MSSHDNGIGMFPQLLGVSQFLENHPAVMDVKFYDKAGATKADVSKWEQANTPFVLPDDLLSFLAISDGFLLKWNISLSRSLPQSIGNTHINPLSQITRHDDGTLEEGKVAFTIDNTPTMFGRVCLVFDKATPTVSTFWFQSLDCTWHYISKSYTDYFRLLIMHLGLPGWCYTFTDTALPSVTEEWFSFLSPERYHIDLLRGDRHTSSKKPALMDLDKISEYLDKGLFNSGNASSSNTGSGATEEKVDRKRKK